MRSDLAEAIVSLGALRRMRDSLTTRYTFYESTVISFI
jgi:hypothetical protein